jgi:2-polyprenyl-3-methyl-5-hydroxy-6-metoxy-1,4-benzoquinol methylase
VSERANKTRTPLFGRKREEVEAALTNRETMACPLCSIEPEPFATDYQGFRLARCPGCGLEFQNPRPILPDLAERVYGANYGTDSHRGVPLTTQKRARFLHQLDLFEKLNGRRGAILDVGCGGGEFLRMAIEQGWEAAGSDIHLSEGAVSSGARLWPGRLSQIDVGAERFDVVRFNHVLEHTGDPLTEILRARDLIRSGGMLYISVPNLAGLGSRLKSFQSRFGLKSHRWRHYAAVHHLWFFVPETLRQLLERAGYRVLFWETPALRKTERPDLLVKPYRRLMEKLHWSDILDMYGRPE